ncbi:trypsin-like serine protease [Streptomyces sp. bgisy153]|uniref:trypsin-like serine protease n=1 Tax=Streptomyces sp. bgisy153 TaxID=3413793 RepID=UPI003D757943
MVGTRLVGTLRGGRRRAALLAAGALVLGTAPAAAVAGPAPAAGPLPTAAQTLGADKPSPQVLRAMQRDLRLTAAQARDRLVNEAEAGASVGLLRHALGERFAGAWVSGATSDRLTVATTRVGDEAAIRAQGAETAVVTTSLSDLGAVKKKLDATAARTRSIALDAPVWYVDVRANRVVVQGVSRAAGDAFVEAAGVDAARVTVQVVKDRPRTLADVVGGDPYYIDDSARCSVGFSVTKEEQQGFATAGHCGDPGAKTAGADRTDQGTFQASVFPGKDMAWVAVNSDWTATPRIRGEADALVDVSGSVQAVVGASVCRSGSTTGWHCGTIQEENVTVRYSEGTVDGLTRTTVCAEPGDSGGPYASGAQAQGTTSGGSGDCASGGTTFFQPVNPVLKEFGLTLKTAGSESGTPGPQDDAAVDTWAEGRVYAPGATVTYGAERYRCLQSHQARGAWLPGGTPALWQRL